MKRFIKKLTSYILVFTVLLCAGIAFSSCRRKASSFTEEEHIQRIRERVEEKIDEFSSAYGDKCEGFDVYPLYSENEEMKYCLVEFQPCGFMVVMLKDELVLLRSCKAAFSRSMYVKSSTYGKNRKWSPYILDETFSQPVYPNDREWILDEKGERILYTQSPYFITGNLAERKYLLETDTCAEFVCAVKRNGEFINLISGLVIDISEKISYTNQSTLGLLFINNGRTDL